MEQVSAVEYLIKELVKYQMISLNNSQINNKELEYIIEKSIKIEKAELEKLKDFDTWKEWKNTVE
jgi:6-phosphofructokinase